MSVHSVELFRQNEAHKARQARLWGKKGAEPVKAEPIAIIEPTRKLAQLDYHVWLYRLHRIHFPPNISTSASFHVETSSEYQPYETHVEFAPGEFEEQPLRQTMKDITLEVLRDFPGVTLEVLRSSRKDNATVMPRQLAMYEIRKRQPWRSFPEIGRFFNRDHATAIYSFLKWDAALNDNEESERRYSRSKERNAACNARIRAAKGAAK